jgi:predicted transcriptional regulator
MARIQTDKPQRLILQAIRQKNPQIRPGGTFDWLIVSNKLRHVLTPQEFKEAMIQLGSRGLIGADPDRRAFTVTEKGFDALQ